MGKCRLRITVLPGPCLYLPHWSRQSSRRLLQAQSHVHLHGTGLSTLCAVTARLGLSGKPHEILSPFPKRIERDLDALPLERALVWERRRLKEELFFGFSICVHGFWRTFWTFPKALNQETPYHGQEVHTLERYHQDLVNEHNKDHCNSHAGPKVFCLVFRAKAVLIYTRYRPRY